MGEIIIKVPGDIKEVFEIDVNKDVGELSRVKEEIEKTKQKDRLLMHQSKLAALGEMLGNIAHQWRHPLTRLSLLIQNLEMAYKKDKLNENIFEKFKKRRVGKIFFR